MVGYRITALPTSSLSLPRLFGQKDLVVDNAHYGVQVGQKLCNVSGGSISQTRAILRGVEYFFTTDDKGAACRIYQDGSVEFEQGTASSSEVYIGWIIANLIRVAKTLNNVRCLGGLPDLEYSVEIEFSKNSLLTGALVIRDWEILFGDSRWELAAVPLKLPLLSFGPSTEIDSFLTQSHTDIFDACGANRSHPIQITIVGT
ncbi:MAG: hypothetical protein ACREC0_02435 [Methylocella sp.]